MVDCGAQPLAGANRAKEQHFAAAAGGARYKALPAWLVLLSVAALAWHAARKLWFAALCAFGFYTIGALDVAGFDADVGTLAASALFIIIIGIPLGIGWHAARACTSCSRSSM